MLNHSRNRRISRFMQTIGQVLSTSVHGALFSLLLPVRHSPLLYYSFVYFSLAPPYRSLRRALFLSATLRRSYPPPLVLLPSSLPLDRAPLPLSHRQRATSLNWLTEQVETKVRCLHLYYNPLFPCLVLMHRIQATWPAAHRSSRIFPQPQLLSLTFHF